jgi:hypothetical protein
MMATKRTWIWVVVGAVALIVLAFIAFAAGMAYLVMRDLEIRDASTVSITDEFESARRRFAGQQPLITLDDINAARPRLTKRPAGPPSSRTPETMHIMAYDATDAKVVRLKLPFWLLRLGNKGNIRIGDDSIEVSKLGLTVSDLERHGPGLVLDYTGKDGDRVLLWME